MNKKRILIVLFILAVVIGFTMASVSSVSAAKGYTKYKGTFKLKAEPSYSPGYGPTYERDGFRKEWRSGQKGKYGGSAEIYLYKKGKKVKKYSILRIGEYRVDSQFKAVVKFRYWNGYKYTNKYKTKSYIKKVGRANTYITSTNWIPYSVKIYTKK